MSNFKEEFITIYKESITREGAEEAFQWLEQSDFFTAPASTRFHGSHEGGLLQHSLNVHKQLKELLVQTGLKDTYSEESVAIVALLHDVCKVDFYKKGTRNVKVDGKWEQKDVFEVDEKFPCGHSEKSIIVLQNFFKLTTDEILAIRGHMGGFDSSVRAGEFFIGKIFEKSKLALLTHMADMQATYLLEERG